MSTVKPTSPSFDFKMPDRRSSSSITRRRTGSSPLGSHLLELAGFKPISSAFIALAHDQGSQRLRHRRGVALDTQLVETLKARSFENRHSLFRQQKPYE